VPAPILTHRERRSCTACHAQEGPLLPLQTPALFVKGEADALCSTPALTRLLLSRRMAAPDVRLVVVPVSCALVMDTM